MYGSAYFGRWKSTQRVGGYWRVARLLLGLLLSLPLAGWAQQPGAAVAEVIAPLGPVFEFTHPEAKRVRLKFSTQRNLIVVAVRLNGCGPYHFLLDTGVGTSLLTNVALADSLHLKRVEEMRVVGTGGENIPLQAFRTEETRVELPGLVARRMSWVLLIDEGLDLSGYAGTRIDGIMGSELFRSLVVSIWPLRSELVCYPAATYQPPTGRRWTSVPLVLDKNKAYIEARVEQIPVLPHESKAPLPLLLVLDTGAGHALSLETSADQRLHLPPEHLRTDLGRGLSGIISGYLGRVTAIHLGRYQLARVLTSFPDPSQVHQRLQGFEARRQGNLGYETLKRFDVVIDYPHKRLLLRPNNQRRMAFEHDMCGLELLATGSDYRRYLVLRVVAGSPAAAAGIEPDEELVSINFLPVSAFALSEVTRLLRAQDGQHLWLILRRPNGDMHPVSVRLRRQI
jgi:hypothetical protein